MTGHITAARLLGAAAALWIAGTGGAAQAQRQVISAVESGADGGGAGDIRLSAIAGDQVGTTFGGVDTRAKTDFGVNKIYTRGVAGFEQTATSAWLDTFTVAGTAGSTVRLGFDFTVDGAFRGVPDTGAEWNYKVYALRGGGWTMNGHGGDTTYGWDKYIDLGSDYDSLILQQAQAGRVTRIEMRDFEGAWNYANVGGQAGALQSHVQQVGSGTNAYYEVTSGAPMGSGTYTATRFYADRYERSVNGGPFQQLGYATTGAGAAALNTYNSLKSNYSVLAMGSLCPHEGCSGLTGNTTVVDPHTIRLEFDLLAGSTFTLASWLYADDVEDATIDFFNTAKVTGVTVSAGGSLTSASGALQALPGGGYGYPAAGVEAAVPEPATWATMIAGFGLIGATLRRRARVALTA